MTVNESPLDRALRALVGVLLMASPILGFNTFPFNLIGLVLVVTAVVGVCPLYSLLHLSTKGGLHRDQHQPG